MAKHTTARPPAGPQARRLARLGWRPEGDSAGSYVPAAPQAPVPAEEAGRALADLAAQLKRRRAGPP